jgi:hypothetical protein
MPNQKSSFTGLLKALAKACRTPPNSSKGLLTAAFSKPFECFLKPLKIL